MLQALEIQIPTPGSRWGIRDSISNGDIPAWNIAIKKYLGRSSFIWWPNSVNYISLTHFMTSQYVKLCNEKMLIDIPMRWHKISDLPSPHYQLFLMLRPNIPYIFYIDPTKCCSTINCHIDIFLGFLKPHTIVIIHISIFDLALLSYHLCI